MEVDKTGQPRSEEDLKEALRAVENTMIHHMLKVPPELAVLMSTIRDALVELLKLRQITKKEKENGRLQTEPQATVSG